MEAALDVLSWIFIVTGLAFCLIGGYGLLKMRDMFAAAPKKYAAESAGTLPASGSSTKRAGSGSGSR